VRIFHLYCFFYLLELTRDILKYFFYAKETLENCFCGKLCNFLAGKFKNHYNENYVTLHLGKDQIWPYSHETFRHTILR